jgi:hypothetical protein
LRPCVSSLLNVSSIKFMQHADHQPVFCTAITESKAGCGASAPCNYIFLRQAGEL